MSDQTRQALRDAIDAHIRDEAGDDTIAPSWLLLAETVSLACPDREERCVWEGDGSQLSHVGLATIWLRQAGDDPR
nr:MAG TPA: hypothetical protein [Caudoviricetes sp.]